MEDYYEQSDGKQKNKKVRSSNNHGYCAPDYRQ